METKSFQSFTERNFSFNFLQFLVYAQNLYFTRDHLGFTCYRRVVFRVQGFLKYQKPTVKSTNYYQLNKYIRFFDQLQRNSLIQYFTDNYYRGLVTVPEVKLYKNNEKAWVVEIWLAEELFNYLHPFIFEDS